MDEAQRETIGERIRRLRVERRLAQSDLAQKGVSLSYVSYVERGQRTPSVKALRLLAARLGVTAEYLEHGVDGAESAVAAELADIELELRLGELHSAERRARALLAAPHALPGPAVRGAAILTGLAAAAGGRHRDAIAAFEVVERMGPPSVAERPDYHHALIEAFCYAGQPAEGAALGQRALDELAAAGRVDPVLYVRFATKLSYALTDLGDLGGAARVLLGAVAEADGVPDQLTAIRIWWAQGRLQHAQGEHRAALRHFQKAIALLERTEDAAFLCLGHLAAGTLLLSDGDPDAAARHLDLAESLAGADEVLAMRIAVERARLCLRRGDTDDARVHTVSALRALHAGTGDADDVGDAWLVLAQVQHVLDEPDLAEASFVAAIDHFERSGLSRKLAAAHKEYAEFLSDRGRHHDAYEAMSRAVAAAGVGSRPLATPATADAGD